MPAHLLQLGTGDNSRLAFERIGTAHPNEGYQGQVVVCSAAVA